MNTFQTFPKREAGQEFARFSSPALRSNSPEVSVMGHHSNGLLGFCTDEQYHEFLQSCPEFERMLVRSGVMLLKYWFSVSDEEQERRFQSHTTDPDRRWKLSPMDLESRDRSVEYSKAKDTMFAHTNIPSE